ncbi:hypothetical protein IU498_03470 [Nocardia beijingensis]|uniref:hypothetical protein n=1 Tax=Nocardia beijingensis TaxID=95162 RepID=UPI001894985D|nr:hypothetical protein [Nocardia beijingensis]MBF6073683.1 hypothetical protein [Nocardia beijingensis]
MIGSRRFAVDPLDPRIHAPGGEPATIQERMRLFYRHAVPLAVDVARRALDGTEPADLGLLIFATSIGVIAPGVDVAVVENLGLPRSVARLVVNFMGCAAARIKSLSTGVAFSFAPGVTIEGLLFDVVRR